MLVPTSLYYYEDCIFVCEIYKLLKHDHLLVEVGKIVSNDAANSSVLCDTDLNLHSQLITVYFELKLSKVKIPISTISRIGL